MKPTPRKRKAEPEIPSGSTKLSRSSPAIAAREKLAKQVEKRAVEAFSEYEHNQKKLRELRPMIAQLREQFMKLTPGEKIAGCRTWTEYCERVFHRTDRRIRQILEGANPASEKHSRKSLQANAEKAPTDATRVVPVIVKDAQPEPRFIDVVVQKALPESPRFIDVVVKEAPPEPQRFVRVNVQDASSEPARVSVPEARNAEWTREMVIETAFKFVFSVFEQASLPDDEHNKALAQLLDKLQQEVFLGA